MIEYLQSCFIAGKCYGLCMSKKVFLFGSFTLYTLQNFEDIDNVMDCVWTIILKWGEGDEKSYG